MTLLNKNIFINYIQNFMDKMKLFPASGRAVVGVSGGLDSMTLLFVLNELRLRNVIKELVPIHINHGTRGSENLKEEKVVSEYCAKLGLTCRVERIDCDIKQTNFEHFAREKRYKVFMKYIGKDDLFYTGHHIDDSFEWSMLQQMKSTSLKSSIGIPVKNENVARPLMCLTRAHIERFSSIIGVEYITDASNLDTRFERNYIRNVITKRISKRFPKYLKQYVYRSTDIARMFNLLRTQDRPKSKFKSNKSNLLICRDSIGGVLFMNSDLSKDFHSSINEMVNIIYSLSSEKRGKLRLQVDKIIDASINGKNGPLSLSGGVKAYMFCGMVYFIHTSNINKYRLLDKALLESLMIGKTKKYNYKNLRKDFFSLLQQSNKSEISNNLFPYLVFGTRKSFRDLKRICPGMRKEHPLFPLSSRYAIKNNMWFIPITKLLCMWQKEKNISKMIEILKFI